MGIGILNEKPLHAALKTWYARPGDRCEVSVEGFVVDIVRGDMLVEIQTGSCSTLKRKLTALTAAHPVRLVYPIAQDRWVVRLAEDGESRLSRRKSPRRGRLAHVCAALVSFPELLASANFSLEAVLIQEEELRRHEEGRGRRRRGWVTQERRLLNVVGQRLFEQPAHLLTLLPPGLDAPWTTADLAAALNIPRRLAQQMAYCLRQLELVETVGKRGQAMLYSTLGHGRDRRE